MHEARTSVIRYLSTFNMRESVVSCRCLVASKADHCFILSSSVYLKGFSLYRPNSPKDCNLDSKTVKTHNSIENMKLKVSQHSLYAGKR